MFWSVLTLIPVLLKYLLLLLTVLYCWFRWSHRDLLRAAAGIPVTHKTWPIFGHSYAAFGGMEELTKFFLEVSKVAVAKSLKTVCFWCGPLPLIMIHDSEDIQTVLNSSNTIDKADEYEYFKFGFDTEVGPLSYTLLTAPGKRWKVTRKHMNPLFHPRNLQHMLPVFNKSSREFVSCLSEHVGHGPVNLMPYTMGTTLKTVCNLVFGPEVTIDMKSPDFHGLLSVLEAVPEMFITRVLQPWLRSDVVFNFFYRKELKKLNLFWNNFTNSRLDMAKETSKQKNLQTSSLDDEDRTVTEPLNYVDAFYNLQRAHPEFTEADMRFEILNLYGTGTDTVGSAIASCLLALAQFPHIQERLYQEVCSVLVPDDDVTLQDLNRMPYLDQVVKETLRLFLTIPYILRKATKDVKLSTCTISAGSTIWVSFMGIHMDPKFYPDPFLFDPDRFSQENTAGRGRSTFIPFSGGPRNCIGKTYAMQLMKIMIVHVLRKFKLKTDMDIYKLRMKLVVTLNSVEGYNVLLEERC